MPIRRNTQSKPFCPSIQDGCDRPERCRSEGSCSYAGSPLINPDGSPRYAAPHFLVEGKRVTPLSDRDMREAWCCGDAPGTCQSCPLIVQPAPGDACTARAIDPATQPSNPKQYYGDKKLPLYLVPFTTVAHLSVALFEGMRKYGLVNWRAAPIEAMTYISAAKRHIERWTAGQRCDPTTGVHHIASMMACGAIILDAELNGTLVDNRPLPIAQERIDSLLAELESVCDTLRTLHADKNPVHYTIANKPASV